ncbi:MAG: acylphosphatase [Anaerolineales bacterium]|nr:acylphosphatase [Anaerolineales bacterium]MCX7608260.1 acylphosphatase [Anaerolineales bacterium]MDW8226783.1 acylphosphatase [Anaerolineales bacterium]
MNAPFDNSSEFSRVHIVVTGRVQGVGFRVYIHQTALALGLTGWVRNVGWDKVEITAEGKRPLLQSLVEAAQRGPRGSRVDDCHVEWQLFTGEFSSFEIRPSR